MKLEVLDNKMTQLLSFIGAHTLDVYVLHFFIVRSISMAFCVLISIIIII